MSGEKTQVFAIIRVDKFHDESVKLENKITAVKIVRRQELAQQEVGRLNQLNTAKDCIYFWQATRLSPE